MELHDFRSYAAAKVEFVPGVNTLVGPNGIGKTNIVEAVGYVSTLSSHRVAADLPLVRAGSAQAIIRAQCLRGERSTVAEIMIIPGRANRIQVSGSPVRPRDLIGRLRTVVFAPEDLSLVKGDPSERRRWLDDALVQRAPRYAGVRADYERVVKQRTTLLKSMAKGSSVRDGSASTLEVWDEQMVTHGASLLFGRLCLLNEISGLVEQAYSTVAPGKPATIGYDPRSLNDVQESQLPCEIGALGKLLRQEIANRRSEEIARGVTLVGPHRDDVTLTINGMAARLYASHGECWSMALSLRLGTFDLMRSLDDGSGDPVLILDDVFAELDESRRAALVSVAMSAEQVLVTAAVAADIPIGLSGTEFMVRAGEVIRVAG